MTRRTNSETKLTRLLRFCRQSSTSRHVPLPCPHLHPRPLSRRTGTGKTITTGHRRANPTVTGEPGPRLLPFSSLQYPPLLFGVTSALRPNLPTSHSSFRSPVLVLPSESPNPWTNLSKFLRSSSWRTGVEYGNRREIDSKERLCILVRPWWSLCVSFCRPRIDGASSSDVSFFNCPPRPPEGRPDRLSHR